MPCYAASTLVGALFKNAAGATVNREVSRLMQLAKMSGTFSQVRGRRGDQGERIASSFYYYF